jgi:hypothetical protein
VKLNYFNYHETHFHAHIHGIIYCETKLFFVPNIRIALILIWNKLKLINQKFSFQDGQGIGLQHIFFSYKTFLIFLTSIKLIQF